MTLASSTQEEHMATLDEQMIITDYIEGLIGDEADMCKVGIIFDDALGDQLLVTVIAAGFEDSHLPFNYDTSVKAQKREPVQIPSVSDTIQRNSSLPPAPERKTEYNPRQSTATTNNSPFSVSPQKPEVIETKIEVKPPVPEPPKVEIPQPPKPCLLYTSRCV